MGVVALGVLGVYQVTSPQTDEAAASTRNTPADHVGAPRRAHRPAARAGPSSRWRPSRRPRRARRCACRSPCSTPPPSTAWRRRSPTPWSAGAGRPRASARTTATTCRVTTVYFTEGDETQRQAALQLVEQFPQLQGPAPRFFELPAEITAPGLVIVAAGRLDALIRAPGRRRRPEPPPRRRPLAASCVAPAGSCVPRSGARRALAVLLPLLAAAAPRRRRPRRGRRRTCAPRTPGSPAAPAPTPSSWTRRCTCRPRTSCRRPRWCSRTASAGASSPWPTTPAAMAGRGYVVLTFSARGFGASTGQIGLDDPDCEVADLSTLVDLLAERDDVGPGRRRRPAGRRRRGLLRRRPGAARRGLRRARRRHRPADHLELADLGAVPVAERRGARRHPGGHPAGRRRRLQAAVVRALLRAGRGAIGRAARRARRRCRPAGRRPGCRHRRRRRRRHPGSSDLRPVQPRGVRGLPVRRLDRDADARGRRGARPQQPGRRARPDLGADAAGAGHPGLALRAGPGRRQRPRASPRTARRCRCSGTPAGTTPRPPTGSPTTCATRRRLVRRHLRGEGDPEPAPASSSPRPPASARRHGRAASRAAAARSSPRSTRGWRAPSPSAGPTSS